ncbi:MAG TPA: hypothetical protein VMX17_04280 [Candidatus Glassbacteria bacterium]|nr:hypothetical protein [Candidatus Glassbacteria bacterium]
MLPKNSKPILVIDCSNLCYQAFFTMGDLSCDGMPVGVIYGFLWRIIKLVEKYNGTNKIYFVFDSQRSYRKKIYPEYKANRKDRPPIDNIEDLYYQIDQLRTEVLPDMGFKNIFRQAFYESDDIIAKIVQDTNKEQFVIVSSDNDLWQLLDYHVHIDDNKGELKTREWFLEFSGGLAPWFWAEAKAHAGCSSDFVIGIKGVGDKTALKYLREELKSGKAFDAIKAGEEQIKFNRPLVFLPFKGKNPIEYEISVDRITKRKIKNVFEKFKFKSMLEPLNLEKWSVYYA